MYGINRKNRILLALFVIIILLNSCESLNTKIDVLTFKPSEFETTFKLGEIIIEPNNSIEGIENILPEIITTVAWKNNIVILPEDANSKLTMDTYIHRRSYLKDFQKYESVTLMLKIMNNDEIVTNVIFTRDSKIPMDSFSKVYDIFEQVMEELQKEYTKNQKEIKKGISS